MAPHPSEKAVWRRTLLDRRHNMAEAERSQAAEAIALHVLAHPLVARATRVACYLSMSTEPGTSPLMDGLLDRGCEVLTPRVAGEALEWVATDRSTTFVDATLGMREPQGAAQDLSGVSLVILPALAVDHRGTRLGRGAGFYDRAMADVSVPRCAVVFAHELVDELPSEPHDVPVDFAVSPHGIFRVEPR